jgi:ankyrin repeat protein
LIKVDIKKGDDSAAARSNLCILVELASWNMHSEIVEHILSLYSHLALTKTFSFHKDSIPSKAIETGDIRVLKLLHQNAGGRHFITDKGPLSNLETCMHWAARFGHVDVVKMLNVEIGIGIENRTRDKGHAPIHWAASYGHSAVIEVLCILGADHSSQDNFGSVPMHYAAYRGRIKAVKMLISRGAAVTTPNKSNQTPLHFAAGKTENAVEILEALREAGADVHAEDNDKRTPYDWAISSGNQAAIAFFKREGSAQGSIEGPSGEIIANKGDEGSLQLKET